LRGASRCCSWPCRFFLLAGLTDGLIERHRRIRLARLGTRYYQVYGERIRRRPAGTRSLDFDMRSWHAPSANRTLAITSARYSKPHSRLKLFSAHMASLKMSSRKLERDRQPLVRPPWFRLARDANPETWRLGPTQGRQGPVCSIAHIRTVPLDKKGRLTFPFPLFRGHAISRWVT
jgi:hypothetical protein